MAVNQQLSGTVVFWRMHHAIGQALASWLRGRPVRHSDCLALPATDPGYRPRRLARHATIPPSKRDLVTTYVYDSNGRLLSMSEQLSLRDDLSPSSTLSLGQTTTYSYTYCSDDKRL